MKIFFGETFLNRQDLVETAICHLIKLKYYKILEYKNNYGIEIVKEEYINAMEMKKSSRRLIKAFPNIKSQKYQKALDKLKEKYSK